MKGGDSKAQTQVWLAQCEESYGLAQVKLFHFSRPLLVLEDINGPMRPPILVDARLYHKSCTDKSHLEQFHLKVSRRCLTRGPLEVFSHSAGGLAPSVLAHPFGPLPSLFELHATISIIETDIFKARASGLFMTPLILVNPPTNCCRSYILRAIAAPTNLPPSY